MRQRIVEARKAAEPCFDQGGPKRQGQRARATVRVKGSSQVKGNSQGQGQQSRARPTATVKGSVMLSGIGGGYSIPIVGFCNILSMRFALQIVYAVLL